MARDFGSISATSVPSESVFSVAGLQITARRNRLAPKTMGIIMCLRSWGLIEEANEESDDDSEDDGDVQKAKKFRRQDSDDTIVDSQV